MYSMTGFGRGECEKEGHSFSVEVKSVNHRYLETGVRIPHRLGALEQEVRSMVKKKLARGKVDVFVSYTNHSNDQGKIWLGEGRLEEYLSALRACGAKYGLEDDLKLSHILSLPDVISSEDNQTDLEMLQPVLMEALTQALGGLVAMREKEGENLKKDLAGKLDELSCLREKIAERAPLVVELYREKLHEKLRDYLDPSITPSLDEGRLETEIAIFADRCAIDEELTRLESHITQYRKLIEKNEPVGRQLDFLTQELNRETNTIASKSSDLQITQAALAMKNVIEKIREQVQNIE
ncbi:MAG: YicC family protein [Firmicutes bacterium]|nr:YicC family protein [Bacillota bacterium]